MNAAGWLFLVTSLALILGVTIRAWWALIRNRGRSKD